MQILHTQAAKEHEASTFYKELLGQAAQNLPSVSPTILKNGNTLHRREQIQLATIVTWEEVVTALQGINDMKTPENDGFAVIFLKRVWSIVGEDIINAVLLFFETRDMYSQINYTIVTLIQKVNNPTIIGEFRPISCSTAIQNYL